MALNFDEGRPIGRIETGKYKGQIIYVRGFDDSDDPNKKASGYTKIDLRQNRVQPLMDPEIRNINYITGPSGSGKSTYAAMLAEMFHKLFPKKDIYFFGRKPIDEDPAFKKIVKHIKQVPIDDALAQNPVHMEDIEKGSLVIFDDVGTIYDKNQLLAVFKLMEDLMEVGRARKIDIIITNHLVNPNDKKFGRTIMNEMQSITVFGRSGSRYQIEYALKKYFGLSKNQIEDIFRLQSRWVTIFKSAPMAVLHQHGAYVLE